MPSKKKTNQTLNSGSAGNTAQHQQPKMLLSSLPQSNNKTVPVPYNLGPSSSLLHVPIGNNQASVNNQIIHPPIPHIYSFQIQLQPPIGYSSMFLTPPPAKQNPPMLPLNTISNSIPIPNPLAPSIAGPSHNTSTTFEKKLMQLHLTLSLLQHSYRCLKEENEATSSDIQQVSLLHRSQVSLISMISSFH